MGARAARADLGHFHSARAARLVSGHAEGADHADGAASWAGALACACRPAGAQGRLAQHSKSANIDLEVAGTSWMSGIWVMDDECAIGVAKDARRGGILALQGQNGSVVSCP